MEFENRQPSSGIDEETRLAASAHRLTLTPLNDTITCEEDSDDMIATRNEMNGPIANIPSDEEVTSPYIQQSQPLATTQPAPMHEHKSHRLALAVSISAVVLLTVATGYLFLTK